MSNKPLFLTAVIRSGAAVQRRPALTGSAAFAIAVCMHAGAFAASAAGPLTEPFPPNLELSTLDGSMGFTLNGVGVDDWAGYRVDGVGDMNGDGIDDLAVGAPEDVIGTDERGEVFVVFGTAEGFPARIELADLDGTDGFRVSGAYSGYSLGRALAGIGDVNGDGLADLAIGVPNADPDLRWNAGRVYVIYGRGDGFPASVDIMALDGADGSVINGIALGDGAGWAVARAGDVNADGINDLLLGSPLADLPQFGYQNAAGTAHVLFGRADGFGAVLELATVGQGEGFAIHGAAEGDQLGTAVAGVGDVNGDGIDDIAVAAPWADPAGVSAAGTSYVVFGSASGFSAVIEAADLDGSDGFSLQGVGTTDLSGSALAGVGDLDADGIGDLAVGAYLADRDGIADVGAAYVVFGRAGARPATLPLADLDGTDGFAMRGRERRQFLGFSLDGAGDLNGDGRDDLVVGAYGVSLGTRVFVGQTYVVFGHSGPFEPLVDAGDLDGTTGFALDGIDGFNSAVLGDWSGYSVAGAGDINGDGVADIVIGAIDAESDYRFSSGEVYVVFGRRILFPLYLTLAVSHVREGGTVQAEIRREGPLGTDVLVRLSTTAPDQVTLPAAVTLRAGSASVAVPIHVIDDDVAENLVQVDVAASADGYTTASVTLAVSDNDGPQLALAPGLNLVPYPAQVAPEHATCGALTEALGGSAVVASLRHFDAGTGGFVVCDPLHGSNFAIESGEVYLVRLVEQQALALGARQPCSALNLRAGINFASAPDARTAQSCFQWLSAIGPQIAASIRKLDPAEGRSQTCAFRLDAGNGQPAPVGLDYPLADTEGYIIAARGAASIEAPGCSD